MRGSCGPSNPSQELIGLFHFQLTMLKIAVGSENAIKLNAVRSGFGPLVATPIGVNTNSGVPEQPEGDETLQGAKNRALATKAAHPDADIVIGIESGIFKHENGDYVDQAVIYGLVKTTNWSELVVWSAAVKFDTYYVEEARRRGFDKHTVGMIMQEGGLVVSNKDPHLILTGKTREAYLAEAVGRLAKEVVGTLRSGGGAT